jgi:glycosyltransferase involved in cell wall biosynthesis
MTPVQSTALRNGPPASRELAQPMRPSIVLLQTQAEAAGAQEISRILGQGLEQRGYDVHHVFLYRRTSAFDHQPNTFFCASQRPNGPFALLGALGRLTVHLRRLKPDVMLSFQHYGNLVGALAAKLTGVPAIIANRNSPKELEPFWTQWLETIFGTTGLFNRMVVNCGTVAGEYATHPRWYRGRIRRIDHGFEPKVATLDKHAARARFGLPPESPLIGSVGRLHASKNHQAAVRLLTHCEDWHLAIAGQGPTRGELLSLARELDVTQRLHLIGELPSHEIGIFLRSLDVFVFPSLMETFGLAVVEAAASGIPVVANDLEVLREVLAVDGSPAALFVDSRDAQAFASAVERLLSDDGLRSELGSCGTGLAERYSKDTMVHQYVQLIEELHAGRT